MMMMIDDDDGGDDDRDGICAKRAAFLNALWILIIIMKHF